MSAPGTGEPWTGLPSHRRGPVARWVAATAVLTRAELLRLLRTEEVWRYLLLPALLIVPVMVFGGVMVMSLRGASARVAVPPDLPEELGLMQALEAENLEVVVLDDPAAAWAAGEVDGAIVEVRDGDGIAGAGFADRAVRARWQVALVADTRAVEGKLRDAAEHAGHEVLADIVALAGGDPERDLEVARVDVHDVPVPWPVNPTRGLVAYGVFALGSVAFFFLSLPVVADRREGVTEVLRVLPVPPTAALWARLFAQLALQLVAAALVAGNVVLLVAPLLRGDLFAAPGLADLPGFVACVVLVNALHVAVGVYAPNAKVANSASGTAAFTTLGLIGLGLLGAPPAWVPLAGILAANTPLDAAIGVVVTLAAAAAVLAACGHFLLTRVSLVLPGAE